MHIHLVEAEEIITLRHLVLRPGKPIETAHFEGDEEPSTAHYAVYDTNKRLIACCTMLERPFQGKRARQLRGMAVSPDQQGKGIGTQLLHYIETHQPIPSRNLWCNARVEAAMFYQNHGWQIIGPKFNIPDVGKHYKMFRKLYNT